MSNSKISAVITPAQKASIKKNVDALKKSLNFLINLSKKERQSLFKMGPKSVSYVELALQIAKNYPGILPLNFNVKDMEKDLQLAVALNDISTMLIPLMESIEDTEMAVGGELMKQSKIIKDRVDAEAKSGDSNMKELSKQLGERFKHRNPKAKK
ncbi:MAG: hypothetical protein HYX39_04015 [Bacteroidetes bacterium]|nr:hypothetical protein [Bacteroidota bacterium]